ncbi:MAG: hypothetical protein A3G52_01815 [Candidatus Taylorbacteria bacterium RIFCSPLOWO2_12_FULL_43_20]|uniref:Sodium/calcium exchanger membrane region domain-containing protein n=1 Tax=Candidatus Taylorbacteria bacterium RIFCSPLOWO2_12_FULL_43_20 TaxID=1802332 RepID=A0A1G2P106_9BACT|nr:MAG: hypothetical protein A3B98_00300 [Candidatus Taylorbacteria bacterium RIFCSPHIGHO2_02_FULL_43_55]OHA29938.1 MAG: hypothetical protein A3E92_03930 [Candidatus Taylorbacteria bacterium RIFCSPHIGHO2_12_FULL_42_34]OHA30570.1 MAG: hypothetical protein A3B09_01550 [Candidatus Taylorbacteria bacterium RIFCSPLOWO2_01_FULL_43_83]OHA38402.1 MAG: hypothetical protein A3H58_04355 [Candidatus Taylorbacteria bacterium RIFCSPLOWO2_02_FULL_43_22b]OHA42010.1 MAG: hypothetical protein A3G52_01815 [Candid
MILFWVIVFILSLVALVKGSDWLVQSAEKIGLSFGLSPFIVGVTIVAMGTSFPELISSLAATIQGLTDVAAANVIGSNIANILLIVGTSAIIGRKLIVSKSLIDLDLPLLSISTVLLLGIIWDKQVTFGESLLVLITYGVYLLYTITHKETGHSGELSEISPEQLAPAPIKEDAAEIRLRPTLSINDFVLLAIGISALVLGAKYLVEALIHLSLALNIATGIIAITAVAIGTSLPELFVSAKAVFAKKSDVALGNIFGSNVFNSLVVIGIPGLFGNLVVDSRTFAIGVPAMAFATLLFVISGISRRIYVWEGAFYLALYTLFIAKIFNLF